jgi:hypothetical protein
MRGDKAVVSNYADLLIELCEIVPDGMVCMAYSRRQTDPTVHCMQRCPAVPPSAIAVGHRRRPSPSAIAVDHRR